MKKTFVALVLSVVLTVATSANAAVINIDFGPGDLYSGTAVASDTGTTWNGFGGGAETAASLLDSSGAASVVTFTKSSDSQHSQNGGGTPTSHDLMEDYLHNGNNAEFVGTVTFGNLTIGGSYNLYLYGMGDQTDQFTDFAVAAANGGASGSTTGPARDPLSTPGNYIVLTGIADGLGDLSYTWSKSAGGYAAHNGVQLEAVTVPEPTAVIMMLGGILGLTFLGWRRKRLGRD